MENCKISIETSISKIQLVKAKAQLGEEGPEPKKFFVAYELHLATIPLVGRFENNSLFIH